MDMMSEFLATDRKIRMEHERRVWKIRRRFWLSMLLLAVVSVIALLA